MIVYIILVRNLTIYKIYQLKNLINFISIILIVFGVFSCSKSPSFKITFENRTEHDIDELYFGLQDEGDIIAVKINEISEVHELKYKRHWAEFFAEATLLLKVKTYSDSIGNKFSYDLMGAIGKSELDRNNINRIIISGPFIFRVEK